VGADAVVKKKIKDLASKGVSEIVYVNGLRYVSEKPDSNITKANAIVADYPDTWIQFRPYTTFNLVKPESTLIPPHTIITKEELLRQLGMMYIDISTIPLIHEWDPIIVWIGGRKGDIIQVDRLSASVGRSTFYRIVI
jgi:DNA-directed RNA polymerase subunit H (RpoH/RPB5)